MNAFPFFPVPAPNETAFSLFSRCIERSGIAQTHILQEFTGQRYASTLLSALPGFLPTISNKMPVGHPWRDASIIAREHTSLPYFTYFDHREDRDRWFEKLTCSDSSQPIARALGLTSYPRAMLSAHPRYCPICVQNDRETHGFPWFHREHQLPGMAICWKHCVALANGCKHCGPYPIKGKSLYMAGRCFCEKITPLPAHPNLPENIEPLLWIAQQSSHMVNSLGSPFGGIRATLRENTLEKGFGRGSLVEPHRLADAIEERFERQTLEWLGTPAWEGENPAPWLRRLLSGQLDGNKHSPALLFLLVIGTLYESVEAFEKSAEKPTFLSEKSKREVARPAWSEELFRLLQEGGCSLPGISKQLEVSIYRLIEEIRQRGWRVPLSQQTRKNLGTKKIAAIREDLLKGIEKRQIMRNHDCSEWALILIELDEPGMNTAFRNASKLRTKNGNRARLRTYLSANPAAGRSDVLNDLPGVYDFLIKHDKEWFYQQIQKKKVAKNAPRKNRVDWALLDKKKSMEINCVFDEIMLVDSKPIHATATAALKRVGLLRKYHNHPDKFPLVTDILQKRSEERPQYLQRRITWAVKQIAAAGIPISLNKLRRIAALPTHIVRDHRQDVIEQAYQLNAAIDEKSYFS